MLDAFFDAARVALGKQLAAAKMTDREKVTVAIGARKPSEGMIRHLYEAAVPAPSAVRGFEDNIHALRDWAIDAANGVTDFLDGLDLRPLTVGRVVPQAIENYRSGYLKLMTAVPEFALWAGQTEHAATQSANDSDRPLGQDRGGIQGLHYARRRN